ncbi:putative polygalacturonase [Diplonema papillatum]|nr:putative polygalacturonase [Diplonema papillatum]
MLQSFRLDQGTCIASQVQFTYTCRYYEVPDVVVPPRPHDDCLDPRVFGAKAGGKEHEPVNTQAIQYAFEFAGCITITGGDYFVGNLRMRSNTRLTLEADGRILNTHGKTTRALLYIGQGVDNVTIDGTGELNGMAEDYVAYYDPSDTRLFPVPPDGQRPWFVRSEGASNLVIRDIRLHNASEWTLRLIGTHNILIDNVDIYGDYRFPNNDGIDPDGSTNVTIINSRIDVGDDGICLKAYEGWGPVRNVTVRNCTIRSKSHAIKFGSPTDEDMYDILFDNITIYDSNAALGIQQRSNGNIWNVTFSNIVLEARYSAPGWWGNGQWLTVSSEPRAPWQGFQDLGGNMTNIRFINITGRSENGGVVSARGNHGSTVTGVSFENVHIVFDKWSNYSSGEICYESSGAKIPCMGALDFRPSGLQDSEFCKMDSCPPGVEEFDSSVCEKDSYNYCRTPLSGGMRGIYFINTHGATFENVSFTWSSNPEPLPYYWGQQICIDSLNSTGISETGVTCNQRVSPPFDDWCLPTSNTCGDYGDVTATCHEFQHRCVCTPDSDFSNPVQDGITSFICVREEQTVMALTISLRWEQLDCSSYNEGNETLLSQLLDTVTGGSVESMQHKCDSVLGLSVFAVVQDVPILKGTLLNVQDAVTKEMSENTAQYATLVEVFGTPNSSASIVPSRPCTTYFAARTVEDAAGVCHALECVPGYILSEDASGQTTCAEAPRPNRWLWWVFSPSGCNAADEGLKSLDKHRTSCPTDLDFYPIPLIGFIYERHACEDGDLRMGSRCVGGWDTFDKTQCRTEKTECGETLNKGLEFFTFQPDCGSTAAMTSWVLEEDDCAEGSGRVVYTCCDVPDYTHAVEKQTNCRDKGEGLPPIEGQHVLCNGLSSDQPWGMLQSFRLDQGTCIASQVQFTYTCRYYEVPDVVVPPRPHDDCLDPRVFGAKAGGKEHEPVNTQAIQYAFEFAGCITITGGDYFVGNLRMRSNTRLTLEADGRILNTHGKTTRALLYIGQGVDNVTIDGTGELNGMAEDYVAYYDPSDTRLFPVPPDGQRPWFVRSEGASNLVIRDIRLHNASEWTLRLIGTHNILIDNVDIYGDYRFPNNDGIDPDGSTNVTIINSRIDVGDDGICLKAYEGWGPVRNVTVRNCTIRSKSHAIKFGSPTDEDMYDILFDNITIYDSNAALGIQQRSNGNIWNVTFSNIVLEARYSAPGWWGNGQWLTVSSEPRAPWQGFQDLGGNMTNIRFINITGRSENGGVVSARGNHGSTVTGVSFENVHIVFDKWSNYSSGEICYESSGAKIPCMGALDFRPSGLQDSEFCKMDSCPPGVEEFDSSVCEKDSYNYCRTPLSGGMRGIYFINTHGATFENVSFTWSSNPEPLPYYWGQQICIDSLNSTGISETGVTCNQRVSPPFDDWCLPTSNTCGDYGDVTATCHEFQHRCVCTPDSDFSNPVQDGITSFICVREEQTVMALTISLRWEQLDCSSYNEGNETLLSQLLDTVTGGSVESMQHKCDSVLGLSVFAVVQDVPILKGTLLNVQDAVTKEMSENTAQYATLVEVFGTPNSSASIVPSRPCTTYFAARTVEDAAGVCHALECVPGYILSEDASGQTTCAEAPRPNRWLWWVFSPSGCNAADEGLKSLDKHRTSCPTDLDFYPIPLIGFIYERHACEDGDLRMGSRCVGGWDTFDKTQCRTEKTECGETLNKGLEFFTFQPDCGSTAAMTSWVLEEDDCAEGSGRVVYTCCDVPDYTHAVEKQTNCRDKGEGLPPIEGQHVLCNGLSSDQPWGMLQSFRLDQGTCIASQVQFTYTCRYYEVPDVVVPPRPHDDCLDPRVFGAKAGGKEHEPVNTQAIQYAFEFAGCITITGGDYFVGNLRMRSNTRLTLEADGRILNTHGKTTRALLYIGQGVDNVTIDGTGELNGMAEDYVAYYDPSDTRLFPVPPDGQRPWFVRSEGASNLVIRDIRLHNASEWTLRLIGTHNILIDNVDIYGDYRFPNNDGIDPDGSTNVTIINSRIDVGDDGICLKAYEGWGPVRNVTVRNCTIRSKSHAIKFGSPTDEDMYDILFDNITIYDSNAALGIQQRSNGNIWNVTFSNIVLEARYSAPGWWGNGQWLTVSSEPRAPWQGFQDLGGNMTNIRFINITGRSENGGVVSARGNHGSTVTGVSFENVHIVFDKWSNYSSGEICYESSGAKIPCMGALDFRPSGLQDSEFCKMDSCPPGVEEFDSSVCEKDSYNYCRTPLSGGMRGIYFINTHGATFENVSFTWSSNPEPLPYYWGQQICIDSLNSTGISETGVTCNQRVSPPFDDWCLPTSNTCGDYGDVTATCHEFQHRCVCTPDSDFSNPVQDGITSFICVREEQTVMALTISLRWEQLDCSSYNEGNETLLSQLLDTVTGGSVESMQHKCDSVLGLSVFAVVQDVPILKGTLLNVQDAVTKEMSENTAQYDTLVEVFGTPNSSASIVPSRPCTTYFAARTVEDDAGGVDNVTIDGTGELNGMAEDYVAYYDPSDTRLFPVPPDGQRPWFVRSEGASNLVIRDIRLHNASEWTLRLIGTHNILIDNVDIYGDYRFPNNDGIDPDGSTNVTIINSRIDVGDDGICLKAYEGWGPVRNVTVRNCTIRSKSHAIKFGSPTDEDMYDILFDNITIYDSNAALGIQQRSNGNIWNVTFSNIVLEARYSAPGWWGNGQWLTVSSEPRAPWQGFQDLGGNMTNIRFINITGRSENGGVVSARGNHGSTVTGVSFENVHIVFDKWSNYSSGEICYESSGAKIPCMGALDFRPSGLQDSEFCKMDSCPPGVEEFDASVCEKDSYNYCRTPLSGGMRGIYFINTHGATFENVSFTWSPTQNAAVLLGAADLYRFPEFDRHFGNWCDMQPET